jgi:hypothetical protein
VAGAKCELSAVVSIYHSTFFVWTGRCNCGFNLDMKDKIMLSVAIAVGVTVGCLAAMYIYRSWQESDAQIAQRCWENRPQIGFKPDEA